MTGASLEVEAAATVIIAAFRAACTAADDDDVKAAAQPLSLGGVLHRGFWQRAWRHASVLHFAPCIDRGLR
jgi:hypothetical protein